MHTNFSINCSKSTVQECKAMLTNACVKVAKSWRPNYGESRARHPPSQISPLHESGCYRPQEAQQLRQHSCDLTVLSAKSSASFTRSDAPKSSARASYFLPSFLPTSFTFSEASGIRATVIRRCRAR